MDACDILYLHIWLHERTYIDSKCVVPVVFHRDVNFRVYPHSVHFLGAGPGYFYMVGVSCLKFVTHCIRKNTFGSTAVCCYSPYTSKKLHKKSECKVIYCVIA